MYERFEQSKDVYAEPKRNTKELSKLMEDYGNSVKAKGGLIFCIYRGKMSEGIDFADEKARAVICVGKYTLPGRQGFESYFQEKLQ